MREELKPCPFCGGTWAGSYNTAERIEVKAWNRRANDDMVSEN